MRTQECLSVYKDSSILTGTTFAMNQNSQFAIGYLFPPFLLFNHFPPFQMYFWRTEHVRFQVSFLGHDRESRDHSFFTRQDVQQLDHLHHQHCFQQAEYNLCLQLTIQQGSAPSCMLFALILIEQIHLPSMSVYSNWPTSKTPLRYVNSIDFNYNSGIQLFYSCDRAIEYLAMGNDKGQVVLYSLAFYANKRKETEAKKKQFLCVFLSVCLFVLFTTQHNVGRGEQSLR